MRTEERARDAVSDLRSKAASMPVPSIETMLVHRRRSQTAAAFLAGAAIAVAVLIPVVLFGVLDGTEQPPAGSLVPPGIDTTLPTTETPPPTSEAPPIVSDPSPDTPLSWTKFDLEGGGPDFITAGPDGFVGFSGRPVEVGNAVIAWYSPDGVEWNEVPYEETLFNGIIITDVTHGEYGFVAAGYNAPPDWTGRGAPVLFSPDGTAWTRLSTDHGVPDGAEIAALVYGDGSYLAVGGVSETEAAVWVSVDGQGWNRVPHDEAAFEDPGWFAMFDVTYGDTGYVAVGGDLIGDAQKGVIWHSPDGVTWTRLAHDDVLFGPPDDDAVWFEMSAVTYGDAGYVAVGSIDAPPAHRAAVWTSPDGLTWSLIEADEGFSEFSENEALGMADVTYGDSGYVAVGIFGAARDEATGNLIVADDAAIWTSPDGLAWTRVAYDDQVFGSLGEMSIRSVVFVDDRYVAVGHEAIDLDPAEGAEEWISHAVIWTSD